MPYNKKAVSQIKRSYASVRPQIKSRLNDFRSIWKNGSEKDIFAELVFCILTPQSKAISCWQTVNDLIKKDMLHGSSAVSISRQICKVRFRNNKAKYIVLAREKFKQNGHVSVRPFLNRISDIPGKREWLVHNVKGYGYKEASHFLRNIGMGSNIAILDRHILKNLKRAGVIIEVPASITRNRYMEIEQKMSAFSKKIGIPMDHLDLLFWSMEAGEIFK